MSSKHAPIDNSHYLHALSKKHAHDLRLWRAAHVTTDGNGSAMV